MTRTRTRPTADADLCFEQSQVVCERILARSDGDADLRAYAAGLMVSAVESVLPAGERALFLTHLARHRQARGRGIEADQARAAAAARTALPDDELSPWLAHLCAVPSGGPGRATWLLRHLHRALGRLGISAVLEGELARALAWRYLTDGLL